MPGNNPKDYMQDIGTVMYNAGCIFERRYERPESYIIPCIPFAHNTGVSGRWV
jgi:hypothetical protein